MTDIQGPISREQHLRPVEGLRARCEGDWLRLTGDPEAGTALAGHLAGAGLHDGLFALVAESNAWAEARFRAFVAF